MIVTLKDFQAVVGRARLPARDREWFPRMLREFASATGQSGREPIVVERERVIGYLQTIKARGRAAWQPLHAVRAIEFYRDRVLKSQEPDLLDIHQALAQAAEREKAGQTGRTRASNLQTGSVGGMEPGSIGLLDASESENDQRCQDSLMWQTGSIDERLIVAPLRRRRAHVICPERL
jgi:hypothetical protein